MRLDSTPKFCLPARASPESLSRMRLKMMAILSCWLLAAGFLRRGRQGDSDGLAGIADFKAGEAAHRDVFAQLADFRGNQLDDRDGLLLAEGLIEQANFLVALGNV